MKNSAIRSDTIGILYRFDEFSRQKVTHGVAAFRKSVVVTFLSNPLSLKIRVKEAEIDVGCRLVLPTVDHGKKNCTWGMSYRVRVRWDSRPEIPAIEV